jgi:hypothetical protein
MKLPAMVMIRVHLLKYLRILESLPRQLQDTELLSFKVFKNCSERRTRRLLALEVQLLMLMLFTELMLLSLWEVDAPLPKRFLTWFSLVTILKPLSKLLCGEETFTTMLLDSFNSRSLSIFPAS